MHDQEERFLRSQSWYDYSQDYRKSLVEYSIDLGYESQLAA